MATYKISYLEGDSYSTKGEHYVDNVFDEYEAVDYMIYTYNLSNDIKILNIELITE